MNPRSPCSVETSGIFFLQRICYMQIAFEDHEIPICVFVPTPCRSGYFEIPPGCRGLQKFTSYGKTPLAMAVQEVAAVPGKFVISGKAHKCFRYNQFWGETTKSSQGSGACKILGNFLKYLQAPPEILRDLRYCCRAFCKCAVSGTSRRPPASSRRMPKLSDSSCG